MAYSRGYRSGDNSGRKGRPGRGRSTGSGNSGFGSGREERASGSRGKNTGTRRSGDGFPDGRKKKESYGSARKAGAGNSGSWNRQREKAGGRRAEVHSAGDRGRVARREDSAYDREWTLPGAEEQTDENRLEGRNPVLEAFRAGRAVDKVFLQSGLQDGMILTIAREARKAGTILSYVPKERLDQMSETGHHQGVIAFAASYAYASVQDILQKARDKGEDPFLFLLDGIEDPHNLGAIIRTANLAGAHGVIITKHRSAMLTATVAKASAGALNYTPVAKVTNLASTMEELKKEGIWFVCADMNGSPMYEVNLTGPIGLVIGNEGEGVSRLIREHCDFTASIPMHGDIDSLNASVAAGVLAYEIVRQRSLTGRNTGCPE